MADIWIHSFYRIVNNLGFPDPIHAAMVHMPMGLIVGAFIFGWLSVFSGWKKLSLSAYHCITLAFLFLFPVVLFGIMDWRHFYMGAWLTPIKMKMALAGILFILSAGAVFVGFKEKEGSRTALILYTLCFITVIMLGWFGARLVYGEKPQMSSKNYQVGEKIFTANCLICHVDGGNKIKPDKPLRNSPDLSSFNEFLSQIRHPDAPMPAFDASQISDKEARDLYDYIIKELNGPGGKGTGS